MATREELPISGLTVNAVLGRPLNDVEDKFAPKILYVKGTMHIPLPRPRVSIVGSRKASPNGLLDASKIAIELAEKEVVIVSGLAEGIDTSAHEATMRAGGKNYRSTWNAVEQDVPAKELWASTRDHV